MKITSEEREAIKSVLLKHGLGPIFKVAADIEKSIKSGDDDQPEFGKALESIAKRFGY